MSALRSPSGLLNQQHPDKTRGDTLSWSGDPFFQWSSTHRSAGMQRDAPSPLCQARAAPPPALQRCAVIIPGFHTIFHATVTAPTPNEAWINEGALDLNQNVACLVRLPCAASIEGNLILVGRHS